MFPVTFVSRFLFVFAAALALLLSAPASADPAGRVGRVAVLDGPTLFRVDRSDAGSSASVNWPVSSGAIFDTERDSRAEIWVGSTAFRLAGEARLEFSAIDDHLLTVQLATGTLSIVIRDRDQAADLDLRLPSGRVRFTHAGRYRIDVDPERSSIVTDAGQAVVESDEDSLTVGPGGSADLDANGRLALYGAAARDSFDEWVAERDAATQVRTASNHVSPQMTGYQDLDGYGDWGKTDDYGSVWYPRAVSTDWAPYRDGRWAWVAPWGWTWVDAAPWGFAPFHYGRWVEVRGRWGWVPGRYVPRPVYAPALVAWIGNPGWSIGLSVGANLGRGPAVGWFPLAPREVYVPSYRASTSYVRQINVTQVTNVRIVDRALVGHGERQFLNRSSARAVTVVPVGTMREGRRIAGTALPYRDARELRQAPFSARAPANNWLAPSPAALRPQVERGGRSMAPSAREHAPRDTPRLPPRPAISAPAALAPGAPVLRGGAREEAGRVNRGRESIVAPRPQSAVEAPQPTAPVGGAAPAREMRRGETPAPTIERRQLERRQLDQRPAEQGQAAPDQAGQRQEMPRQAAQGQAERRQAMQGQAEQRQTEQRQATQREVDQRQNEQRQATQREADQRQNEQRQAMQREVDQRQNEQRQAMQGEAEQRQNERRQAMQGQADQRQADQRQATQRQADQRWIEQRQAMQRQADQRQADQRQATQRQAEQRQAEQRSPEPRSVQAPAGARSPESRREGWAGRGERGERDGAPGR